MEDRQLEQSIIKTIAFFDLFDYPLTVVEIYKWLCEMGASLERVDFLLSFSEYIKERVATNNGLYFLIGRNDIVSIRLDRYLVGYNKFKIVNRGLDLIKSLPFIKFVGVGNSIGSNNIKSGSDIDLLVVTSSGRLYLTRFLVTLILNIFRLRRHQNKITNRLCLSFYVSSDNLDLAKIKIGEFDHYLSYWLVNLIPVYDRGGYNNIIRNNQELLGGFKNFFGLGLGKRVGDNWFNKISYEIGEFFLEGLVGNGLEWVLQKVQIFKMSHNKKSLAKCDDSRVIINGQMLKFHENDRRQYYNNQYNQLVSKVL